MDALNLLKQQFQHMLWADAKVTQVSLALEQAKNDEKLKHLFYHVHIVQHAFLNIWTVKPADFPKEADFNNLIDIHKWSSAYDKKISNFLRELKEDDLLKIITVPWAKRVVKVLGENLNNANLAETMMQVTSHSMYHRGQINARLKELGGEPPLVDFIAWAWLGKTGAA